MLAMYSTDWYLSQRLGRSDAASIIDSYWTILLQDHAAVDLQEVKKVEVIEQACLFGFSWGANPLPNSLLLHLISTLFYMYEQRV